MIRGAEAGTALTRLPSHPRRVLAALPQTLIHLSNLRCVITWKGARSRNKAFHQAILCWRDSVHNNSGKKLLCLENLRHTMGDGIGSGSRSSLGSSLMMEASRERDLSPSKDRECLHVTRRALPTAVVRIFVSALLYIIRDIQGLNIQQSNLCPSTSSAARL